MAESSPLPTKSAPSRWKRVRTSPWFHLCAALLVVGIVHGFIVKPYAVPSGSMEHTLEVGDRIYANRLAYVGSDPQRGDIVVFNQSAAWETPPEYSGLRYVAGAVGDVFGFGPSNHHALVKRVIGLPGDTVRCCDDAGAVVVNGESLDEPYVFEDYPFESGSLDCTSTPVSQRCFGPIEVGRDEYLMLGDHRSRSSDSVAPCRTGGAIPDEMLQSCARFAERDELVGEIVVRVWPLSRAGRI